MSFVFDIAGARQSRTIGKYNQAIQERNAKVAEQEGQLILDQFDNYTLPKLVEKIDQLEGETKVAFAKSGVEESGTARKIKRYNAEQGEKEIEIARYNAEIGKSRKFEEANFARMQGSLARMQAKQAEIAGYARAGESLMRMYG